MNEGLAAAPGRLARIAKACAVFVPLYIALDWATYLAPLQGLNITPWNPGPALALLFLIRHGWPVLPAVWLALFLGDFMVRGLQDGFGGSFPPSAMLALGYAVLADILRRGFADNGMFSTPGELFRWAAWVAFGTLGIGALYVATLLGMGMLDARHWLGGLIRFWVGDGVGIFIAMPLFWWLMDAAQRAEFLRRTRNWESLGYILLTLVVLWVAFDLGARAHYRYFYVLFLPVVWAATRQGFAGAVLCVSLLQVGMVVAGSLQDTAGLSLLELQMRALLLASVGFVIGTAIDEQRRYAADLRHTTRLAVAGEMAGALAHEINQPLTALSAYASACVQVNNAHGDPRVGDLLRRLNDEAARLADIVRRLRDFLRGGETRLELCSARGLVDEACARTRERFEAEGLRLCRGDVPDVRVYADPLQLGVVLRNLLHNAYEAALANPEASRDSTGCAVRLAGRIEGNALVIEVIDMGTGIEPGFEERVFEPFATTKSSGLGLGLAISRAIAEAHGGRLTTCGLRIDGPGTRGGCFRLDLPLEVAEEE